MTNEGPENGLPQGLQGLLQQAQGIQKRLTEVQAEMANRTVVGEAGGGMVRVTVNGRQEVLRIEIEPEVIDPNEREMLQDLIVAATNVALRMASEMVAGEVGKVTGGLGIPGLF